MCRVPLSLALGVSSAPSPVRLCKRLTSTVLRKLFHCSPLPIFAMARQAAGSVVVMQSLPVTTASASARRISTAKGRINGPAKLQKTRPRTVQPLSAGPGMPATPSTPMAAGIPPPAKTPGAPGASTLGASAVVSGVTSVGPTPAPKNGPTFWSRMVSGWQIFAQGFTILGVLVAILWGIWTWWLAYKADGRADWTSEQQLKQSCIYDQVSSDLTLVTIDTLTMCKALNISTSPACQMALSTPTEHWKRQVNLLFMPTNSRVQTQRASSAGSFLRPNSHAYTPYVWVFGTLYTAPRLFPGIAVPFPRWLLGRQELVKSVIALFVGLGWVLGILGNAMPSFSPSNRGDLSIPIFLYSFGMLAIKLASRYGQPTLKDRIPKTTHIDAGLALLPCAILFTGAQAGSGHLPTQSSLVQDYAYEACAGSIASCGLVMAVLALCHSRRRSSSCTFETSRLVSSARTSYSHGTQV